MPCYGFKYLHDAPIHIHFVVLGGNTLEWPLIEENSLGLLAAVKRKQSFLKFDGDGHIPYMFRILKFRDQRSRVPWLGSWCPSFTH
jgi:hypothetical protein